MTEPKKYRIIPYMKSAGDSRDKKVEVIFTSPMNPAEWKELRETLIHMLKEGYSQWRFNLQGIEYPTSTDLGMWVTCNAMISSQSGSIEFLIPRESNVQKVLSLTKLDTIFTTVLT